MTDLNNARRQFKSGQDKKQDVSDAIAALMGQGNGVVNVPTMPGYVYYRASNQSDFGIVFNNRCPVADNLAIYVGYDPITDKDRRLFQVLSTRMGDYAGAGNTPTPNVPPHHETHEYGGGDDVYVSWRRIMGLRVGRASAFNVTVDPGIIFRTGVWTPLVAQTVALAGHIPASGARYVLIALDAAGVAVVHDGTIKASVALLLVSDCPAPTASEFPLAAVRLYAGQASIGDTPTTPDIIDLRWPQTNPANATHNILSATHSDTLAAAIVDGDVLIGNATPVLSRLGISIPVANVRNVFGVDSVDSRPSWKTALDATNPTTITAGAAAAPGTSLVFAHRDHTHGAPATWASALTATYIGYGSASNLLTGVSTFNYVASSGGSNDVWTFASIPFPTASYVKITTGSLSSVEVTEERGHDAYYKISESYLGVKTQAWTIGSDSIGTTSDLKFRNTSDTLVASLSQTGVLSLTPTSNQIVLQSAGITGTLTWTPATTNKIITFPNLTGTVALINVDNAFTAPQTITSTTAPQLKVAYDGSNYFTASVSAAGAITLAATGASAAFGFSNPVTVTSTTAPQFTAAYNGTGYFTVGVGSAAGVTTLRSYGTLPNIQVVNDVYLTGGQFMTALTDGSTGGFRAGTTSDVLLYRGAADTWRTPDSLTVDGTFTVGAGAGTIATTAAGALSLAITAAKTLTLTSADTYNVTVPATGTLALLGVTNIFTAVQTINLNAAALPAGPTGTILQIGAADGAANRITLDGFAGNGNLTGRRANNTAATPQALASGNTILALASFGYGATGYSSTSRATISFVASEAWSDAAQGTRITFNTTTPTTTTTAERFRITDVGISTDGGTNEWLLGAYTVTAPAATGYVTVTINGTSIKLLASI